MCFLSSVVQIEVVSAKTMASQALSCDKSELRRNVDEVSFTDHPPTQGTNLECVAVQSYIIMYFTNNRPANTKRSPRTRMRRHIHHTIEGPWTACVMA